MGTICILESVVVSILFFVSLKPRGSANKGTGLANCACLLSVQAFISPLLRAVLRFGGISSSPACCLVAFNVERGGRRAESGAVGVTVVCEDDASNESAVEITDDSACVR